MKTKTVLLALLLSTFYVSCEKEEFMIAPQEQDSIKEEKIVYHDSIKGYHDIDSNHFTMYWDSAYGYPNKQVEADCDFIEEGKFNKIIYSIWDDYLLINFVNDYYLDTSLYNNDITTDTLLTILVLEDSTIIKYQPSMDGLGCIVSHIFIDKKYYDKLREFGIIKYGYSINEDEIHYKNIDEKYKYVIKQYLFELEYYFDLRIK